MQTVVMLGFVSLGQVNKWKNSITYPFKSHNNLDINKEQKVFDSSEKKI